ncbi:hypothetical protein [Alkalihalobacillus sp. TS-13]|uniref:hypothetical protein n=1 Tax=Alkalihalobacillus sp. TS-13 TaxID=2842455 RepID=UPI001C88C8C8|nr:hypothetical protein [Alkalihalobacillus sp. TS-13]
MPYRKYMKALNNHNQMMQKQCKKHINQYVQCHMMDGKVYEGYVEKVDKQNIYLIIEVKYKKKPGMSQPRQYLGFPEPGLGFERIILPLHFLTAVSLVPY